MTRIDSYGAGHRAWWLGLGALAHDLRRAAAAVAFDFNPIRLRS